jgi:hypothetical protein
MTVTNLPVLRPSPRALRDLIPFSRRIITSVVHIRFAVGIATSKFYWSLRHKTQPAPGSLSVEEAVMDDFPDIRWNIDLKTDVMGARSKLLVRRWDIRCLDADLETLETVSSGVHFDISV